MNLGELNDQLAELMQYDATPVRIIDEDGFVSTIAQVTFDTQDGYIYIHTRWRD